MSLHPRSRAPRALIALVAVALALASACSSPRREDAEPGASTAPEVVDGEPTRGGVLSVGLLADVDSYHPTAGSWTVDGHLVGSTIFEPLMAYDADGVPQPYLAESVVPNDDLTRWTITVKPDVTFHDGTPLDGDALARNVQAALFEGLISIAFEGTVLGVEVTGPRSIELELASPVAIVPEVLTGVAGYVAAPSFLDDPTTDPSGTGPFRFVSRIPGTEVRVAANPDYWRTDDEGRSLPYLDEIEFHFLLDDAGRFDAMTAGDLDLVLTTNADDIVEARTRDDLATIEDLTAEETVVMLNAGAPPFDDPLAREALAYGTDAATLIDATQGGLALPATSPFDEGSSWATADDHWAGYDPGRAAAAVAAYEEAHGEPLSFSLSGLPTADAQTVLQELTSQWSRLGIEAEIDTLEPVAYIVGITFGSFEAAWWRSYSYEEPLYLYPFFHSRFANGVGKLSTNFSQVVRPDLDALLEAYLAEEDLDARHDLVDQMLPIINDEQVNIWLFHTPFALVGTDVGGLAKARDLGFASLEPKPWVGELWREER